jgi:hypothetical protein
MIEQLFEESSPKATNSYIDPVTALRNHIDSIPSIFGQLLPGPAHIQAVWGTREGEVCFIIHPNGDIQAHQWSKNESSWRNIGQYSYNRKGVEGILKSEQLKGQKIGHTMPRNTLEYFVAIAKQYEETSIAKASELTGYEKGGVQTRVRPAIPLAQHLHRPPLAVDTSGEASRSFSSAGYSCWKTSLPTMSSFATGRSNRYEPRVAKADRFSNVNFGHVTRSLSPMTLSSGNISPFTSRKSMSPEVKRVFAPSPRNNVALSQSGLLRYSDHTSTTDAETIAHLPFTNHLQPQFIDEAQADKEMIFQQEQQRIEHTNPQSHRQIINEDSDGETDVDSVDQMKDVLMRQYLNAVETPYISPTLQRRDRKITSLDSARYDKMLTSTFGKTRSSRTAHIMTATELSEFNKPTPQHWAGHFFDDDEKELRSWLIKDEKLNDWCNSSSKPHTLGEELRMHDESHQQAPIGIEPKTNSDKIESLLLPVRETLQSYMDPAKRDYFSRFAPPPEHCIDNTSRGRQSFFGEDYGPQPARLEKDPRYRHLGLSSMGFEEQIRRRGGGGGFRSSLSGLGRSSLRGLGESSLGGLIGSRG